MITIKQINLTDTVLTAEITGISSVVWGYDLADSPIDINLKDTNNVINELLHFDDVQLIYGDNCLNFKKADYQYRLTEEEIKSFKYRPFIHQIEAINYGLSQQHHKWLLLDSMGLGKSLEMMYLAETLYRRGQIEHCMIICGVDSLRTNWRNEIRKFSNLDCVVLGEYITRKGTVHYKSVKARCEQLLSPISEFFIVVNISTIRSEDFLKAFKKTKNNIGLICFDEAHRCVAGDTEIQTSDGIFTVEQLFGLPITDWPKVLTYNTKTKVDEFKEILDISRSEPEEALVELFVENFGEIYTLKCTESHKIYTYNRGWVKAKDLTTEDNIKISAKFNRNS